MAYLPIPNKLLIFAVELRQGLDQDDLIMITPTTAREHPNGENQRTGNTS